MVFDDVIGCAPGNEKVYSKIIKGCRENKIIPFVGAGLSIPPYEGWCDSLRAVMSTDICDDDRKEIENLFNENRFEEAADKIHEYLGLAIFEDNFYDVFNEDKIKKNGLSRGMKLLPQIFSKSVITTNFDKCLEHSYSLASNQFGDFIRPNDKNLEDSLDDISRGDKHYLWKIHGDVEKCRERVFTTSEYDKAYRAYENKVKSFFRSNVFLFLGCSLSGNDRYMKIFSEIVNRNNRIQNYAVLQKPKDSQKFKELKLQLSNFGILALWYPEDDSKHESVPIVLARLAEDIKKGKDDIDDLSSNFKTYIVSEFITTQLQKRGIIVKVPSVDEITVDDIVSICIGKHGSYSSSGLEHEIYSLLGDVYGKKYSDMRIENDVRGIDNTWVDAYNSILKKHHILDISKKKTLVVGIGNGEEGNYFNYKAIDNSNNLIISDIAQKSLAKAKKLYPNAIVINQPAQKLSHLADKCIDVYISTKTYQSTYFNIEKAIYEANRILKTKGVIILSVVNGFIDKDKSYLQGLLAADGKTIDKGKPMRIVNDTVRKLQILGFSKPIIIETKSEIFVSAKKM